MVKEERKANGRIIALCVAVFIIFLMLYHAWIRRTAYADYIQIIVPVFIMLLYTAWVLYSAKRHKRKMIMLQNATSLNSVERIQDSNELNNQGEASSANRSFKSASNASVRCTHVNELTPKSSRILTNNINSIKHEKIRSHHAGPRPAAKILPRQQSTLTPESVKEFTHIRRFSLDPAMTKVELDKMQQTHHHHHHGHHKKAKGSKEKTGNTKG